MLNQVAVNLQEVFQAVFLNNTLRDDHFPNYGNYFDNGRFVTNNMMNNTQLNTSWYILLFFQLKKFA